MEALRLRFGAQGLRSARELLRPALPPAISTGLPALDALSGCRGLPCGAISLLGGGVSSGKSSVAFRALAQAQAGPGGPKAVGGSRQRPASAAAGDGLALLLDLSRSADPGYLQACGVDLGRLILARPRGGAAAVALLLDLLRQEAPRLVVVHSLADLVQGAGAQALRAALPHCVRLLRAGGTALLVVEESRAPWLPLPARQEGAALLQPWAALHLRLEREAWLGEEGDEAEAACQAAASAVAGRGDGDGAGGTRVAHDVLAGFAADAQAGFRGYRSLARLLRSRWRAAPAQARLEIPVP